MIRPFHPARRSPLAFAAALAAPFALAACGEAEEPAYEAGVTDVSGGEFIVRDADETGTPVAPGSSPTPAATPE